MLKAKICGLTKDSEIKSCIEFGAAFCGFILNWPKSHRYINIDKLRSLTKIKIKSPEFVGVLVNPTDEEINIFSSTNLQYFQLHGEENIDRIKEIKQISKKKIIKTIKVNNEKDIEIYTIERWDDDHWTSLHSISAYANDVYYTEDPQS